MATDLYCTIDEARYAILGGQEAKPDAVTQLTVAVKAACRQIDKFCDRGDGFGISATATARVFVPEASNYVFTDDIASTVGLIVKTDENGDAVHELTWSAIDYQLEPVNAPSKDEGRPYTAIRATFTKLFPLDYGAGSYLYAGGKRLMTPDSSGAPTGSHHTAVVQVTAKWGWPVIPSPIHDAAIQQSIYLYKSFAAPFGIAGAGDTGEVRMLGEKLHPTAKALCSDFRKGAGGAS